MKYALKQQMGRREFLRSAARYLLLAGALVFARVFSLRQTGTKCQKTTCRNCASLKTCDQPQAGTARAS